MRLWLCRLLPWLLLAATAGGQTGFLSQSTYLGGDGTDVITSVVGDNSGSSYVAGYTYSSNLPTTPSTFQSRHGGVPGVIFSVFQSPPLPDAFVAKFDRSGVLAYLTYLGGRGYDAARSIAVDAGGNVVVVGATSSEDFPVTAGSLNPKPPSGPGQHIFVAKLNASGSGLLFATYLGGDGDSVSSVALDSNGDAYLAGSARSGGFPVTPGAPGTGVPGGAFAVKLSADGSRLLYSALLGGDTADYATGIAVDGLGNAYVAGAAASGKFPVTAGAFQRAVSANVSAFVAKLDPSGTTLLCSTLLGGSDTSLPSGRIAVDSEGNVSLTGLTLARDFPVTPGAFQRSMAGVQDAFVTKLNATLSGLVFSTYLGGSAADQGSSLAQDSSGNLWIAGATNSTDLPVTTGELSRRFAGSPCISRGGSPFGKPPISVPCLDAFVAELSPAGNTLLYSTPLSGDNQETASDLGIDSSGSITVAGSTRSNQFPVTLDAFQARRYRAACTVVNSPSSSDTQPCDDGFLARFRAAPPAPQPFLILNCAGYLATPVAPGEIVSLLGQGIGPAAPAGLAIDPPGFVSTANAGIRALFDGTPGPLIYLDSGRIDVIVPHDVGGRTRVTVAIERGGVIIASAVALVTEAAPGILVQGAGATGQAAALNQDATVNDPRHPAQPGSIVSLYTLGVETPAGPDGQVANSAAPLAAFPEVVVGNAVADVLYAGPSPGLVSVVTQINFVVPPVTGDAVPIYIVNAGYASPFGAVVSIR